MVFSSNSFVAFFIIFCCIYYSTKSIEKKNIWIFIGSLAFLFYAGAGHILIILAVLVTTLVFITGARSYWNGYRWLWMVISFLTINLAYFKYREFISEIIGADIPAPVYIATIIPLGISFYTLQIIGALYDRRHDLHQVNLWTFAKFIVFFPQLIAGPICKLRALAPQFSEQRRFSTRNIYIGSQLFVVGYIKKVAVADPVGALIDPVWENPTRFAASSLLIAVFGFAVQVYADFSGYTDMGRGAARILGHRLPINFRGPYLAASPIEFWSRWHMTLSNWIRYYMFNPLSITIARRIRNKRVRKLGIFGVLLFVMGVIGLWHGAAFQFIAFGLIQGVFIAVWYQLFGQGELRGSLQRVAGLVATQSVLILSFIAFRADGPDITWSILRGILQWQGGVGVERAYLGFGIVVFAVIIFQIIEYSAATRSVGRTLVLLRKSPIIFVVLSVIFYIVFFFKGIALEGIWYPKHGGQALENFIYFNF